MLVQPIIKKDFAKLKPSAVRDLGTCMCKQPGGFVLIFFLDTAVFIATVAEVSI